MKSCSICLALLLPLATTAALAQKFTPGLWENSMTMKSGGTEMDAQMARMKEEMAKMPPEQRKMMEDMMAKQGVSVGAAGKAVTVKVCVTPEMAARDEMPQNDGNCKQTSKERSGNTVRVKFACSGKEATSGESEYTLISDKQHKGRTVVNSIANGKPQRVEMEHSGKWIAADCGDLKPRK
jgi:hypothetical protein